MRYALEHPQRIQGQVFTNSISGLSRQAPDDPALQAARTDALRQRGRSGLEAMRFYPRPSSRRPAEINDALVGDAPLLSVDGVAMAIAHTIPDLCVAEDLGRTRVPTLLVNGRRETIFQPMRDLAVRELPGLEVVDLDGGHSINLDCPEAFNAAVADFIRRHS